MLSENATLLVLANPVSAEDEPIYPASPDWGIELDAPTAGADDAEREAYWRARASQARNRVAAAEQRLADAQLDYQKLRQRRTQRGEPRAAISGEREAAQMELSAALRYRDDELPDEARRAGALPGWVRE